jgi:hypothetical protein
MNIKLTATPINTIETNVSIEFSNIKDENFTCIQPGLLIQQPLGQFAVIFHIKGTSYARIDTTGSDTVTFDVDFKIERVNSIRVFYWNDANPPDADSLQCFEDFLDQHGLNDKAPIGSFICEKSQNKALLIPRQAGNGGVLGIKKVS